MDYRCGASFGNAGSGMDATMTTIPCVFRCGWFFTHVYIYTLYMIIYIYDYIYIYVYTSGTTFNFCALGYRHWHSNCPKP